MLALGWFGAAAAAPASLPIADGPTRCAAAPGTEDMWLDLSEGDTCRVTAFKQVPAADPAVFYQRQDYDIRADPSGSGSGGDLGGGSGGPRREGVGIVLFVRSADGARLVPLGGWSGAEAAIDAPRLVRTPQGRILLLPMSAEASAHPTYDVVFRVIGGRWVQVSTDGWRGRIVTPRNEWQRHGNAMDWPTLRVFGAFWKPADPECCPTGGSYIARLRLDGARLRVASVRYSRGDLPFP